MDGEETAAAGHVTFRLSDPGPAIGVTVMLTAVDLPVETWAVALPYVMSVPAAFLPLALTVHEPETSDEMVAVVPVATVVVKVAPLGPVPDIT